MSVIGSAAMTTQRVPSASASARTRVAEAVGVGEEQRGVEAVQDQAGDQRRVRVAAGVVVALEVLDAAEHGVVRVPGAADEVEQAQRDRDPDTPQHAEHGDAGERSEAERELGPPPGVQAAGGAHIEQAEHGDDDHGGQGAERHVVDEAGAGDQQQRRG